MHRIDVDNLRLVLYPDPVLQRVAAPVEEFGPELARLAERMLTIMREEKGLGLAAPQVGVSLRLFVCNLTGEPGDDHVFVNPRFLELRGAEEQEEGCLSLPGVTVTVRRATYAEIEAQDLSGRRFTRRGEGLEARVWQHEADHLDGRLIIDYMSAGDELANRRALRQLRRDHVSAR